MIKPLKDFVLIKEITLEEQTASGIIIPDQVDQEPPTQGIVVEKGDKVTEIEIGNTVMFRRYGMEEIEVDKVKYLIGQEEHIFAVITK